MYVYYHIWLNADNFLSKSEYNYNHKKILRYMYLRQLSNWCAKRITWINSRLIKRVASVSLLFRRKKIASKWDELLPGREENLEILAGFIHGMLNTWLIGDSLLDSLYICITRAVGQNWRIVSYMIRNFFSHIFRYLKLGTNWTLK